MIGQWRLKKLAESLHNDGLLPKTSVLTLLAANCQFHFVRTLEIFVYHVARETNWILDDKIHQARMKFEQLLLLCDSKSSQKQPTLFYLTGALFLQFDHHSHPQGHLALLTGEA